MGEWPKSKIQSLELSEEGQGEMPKSASTHAAKSDIVHCSQVQDLLQVERFSSLTRLKRILGWILRFLQGVKSKVEKKKLSCTPGVLSVEELDAAEKVLIADVQREKFADLLKMPEDLCKGPLKKLAPFVDQDGILRVGGRLQNSNLPYEVRHPVILPASSHISTLIIRKAHEMVGHSRGVNEVWAEVRQKYWILKGREAVKKLKYQCFLCRRKRRTLTQQMAPLPSERCVSLRAFDQAGVDFAGPFVVKIRRVSDKRYLCLFTCLQTRAVHLEMTYSMDTSGFLMAFSRMVARRGKPSKVTSDNGSNFIGGEGELRALVEALDQVAIANQLATQGVEWQWNPPEGSHHGGIFESMIKLSKRSLYSILKTERLTDEELSTAFVETEGILNSRPLQYVGDDPDDEPVLTPNHFLIGRIGGQLAPVGTEQLAYNPRNRWRLIQDLTGRFWKRWSREYLVSLQPRGKWHKIEDAVKVGDVVLLTSHQNPRGLWPLARVVEVYPGCDELVRTVKVFCRGKEYVRPITRLIPLVSATEQ